MRYVTLPGTDIHTSSLGFGCASLGSRVSKRDGLDALERGFDEGVSWFDLAPIYGGGLAEPIFGEFINGKRDQVQICTKVGVARPSYDPLLRMAGALVRPIVSRFSLVHSSLRKVSKRQNFSVPLSKGFIEASLEQSLKRMRTDYVDVFALHDPSPEDIAREDVLEALQNAVDRGQARYICVAGGEEAVLAAVKVGSPYRFLQFADNPDSSIVDRVNAQLTQPTALVTHSILGIGGAKDNIMQLLKADQTLLQRLRDAGYQGSAETVAVNLLMDRALATNPSGVVLSSMFSNQHLESNIRRVETTTMEEVKTFLGELFLMPDAKNYSIAS